MPPPPRSATANSTRPQASRSRSRARTRPSPISVPRLRRPAGRSRWPRRSPNCRTAPRRPAHRDHRGDVPRTRSAPVRPQPTAPRPVRPSGTRRVRARFGMAVGGRYTAYAEDDIDVSSPFVGPAPPPTATLTPTPMPTPTVEPVAVLEPDLGKVARRVRFRRRAVRLRLRLLDRADRRDRQRLRRNGEAAGQRQGADGYDLRVPIPADAGDHVHARQDATASSRRRRGALLSVSVGDINAARLVTLRR